MPRPMIPANLAAQRRRPQTAAPATLPRLGAALRPLEPPRREAAATPQTKPPQRG